MPARNFTLGAAISIILLVRRIGILALQYKDTKMKLISKSELMRRVIEGHARECFEHSECGIFDVTAMRESNGYTERSGRKFRVREASSLVDIGEIHETFDRWANSTERTISIADFKNEFAK